MRRAAPPIGLAILVGAIVPLVVTLWQVIRGTIGANPIAESLNRFGLLALIFLILALAMTPLRIVFGLSWPITLRRLLGLFAFFYVCLHFSVWMVLDFFFDWPRMWADIVKRPYITVGMAALLSLIPLAATSTTGMIRRLGARNWTRLHRLAYVAAVCGVVHYLWLAKVGVNDPYWYAAALMILLGVRVWEWGRRAMRRRHATPAVRSRAENPLS